MKLPDISDFQQNRISGTLNVFSLLAVSFTWAHFLNLISIWWLPLTVFLVLLGYGSEINKIKKTYSIDVG